MSRQALYNLIVLGGLGALLAFMLYVIATLKVP